MKTCPHCQSVNLDVNTYCEKCGELLESVPVINSVLGTDTTNVIPSYTDTPALQYFSNIQPVKKSKTKFILIGIVGCVFLISIIAFFALFFLPRMLVSPDDLMARGDYKKAYSYANAEEKEEVLKENMIAYICKDVPDALKNPSSFELRNAWYDPSEQRIVLEVGGTNSYGGVISNYWYYTYQTDEQEYGLWTTISDMDDEEYDLWDDSEETLEKLLNNAARSVIRKMREQDSLKLSKAGINRINDLFQNDILDDVELLDENIIHEQTDD